MNASIALLASGMTMSAIVVALAVVGLVTSIHGVPIAPVATLVGLSVVPHAVLALGALIFAVTMTGFIVWRNVLATGRLEELMWSVIDNSTTWLIKPQTQPVSYPMLRYDFADDCDAREYRRVLVIAPCASPASSDGRPSPDSFAGHFPVLAEDLQLS